MLERSFKSLGAVSQKHSRKVVLLWIIAILLLAPFAGLLFSETTYNLASGIFPSNSMSSRAQHLLNENFPNESSKAGDQSLVIVTTGTDINSRNVVDSLLEMDSGLLSYVHGEGMSGNVSSILTVENSSMTSMSGVASGEMKGSYELLNSTAQSIKVLNASLNGTLRMIYGVPALFLSNFEKTGNASQANSLTYSEIEGEGQVVTIYYMTFYGYWNSSDISGLLQRTNYSIQQTVTNQTSPYYKLSVSVPQLHQMSLSLMQNFSLSDFQLSNETNLLHFYSYVRSYTYAVFVPALSSQGSAVRLITIGLNLTVAQFFNDSFTLSLNFSYRAVGITAAELVKGGLENTLRGNPYIELNSRSILPYLYILNNTSVSSAVKDTISSEGFSSYPFLPTPYVFHQFVGYDNSTLIFVLTTSGNLSARQSAAITKVISSDLSTVSGSHFYLAGSTEQSNQLSSETLSGMIRALIIGIILSIIIVGVFFRSITAAFLPLLMFGVSAMAAFSVNGLLYRYILHSSISFITPTLLLILLLGLSSDYVVYMMARFRRELRKGNRIPAVTSTQWAGHAIFTSGATVALSYIALYISGVPLFSDSGITNAVGVMLAVLVANTLLVALLNIFREKLFWPTGVGISRGEEKTVMYRISRFVITNKGKLLAVFIVVAVLGMYVYASTPTNFDVFDLIPASSGVNAIEIVSSSFHGDVFDIGYIVLQFPSPVVNGNGTYNVTEMAQITSIENTLSSNRNIEQIQGPTYPFGYYVPFNLSGVPQTYKSVYISQMMTYIGKDAHYVRLTFVLSSLAWRGQASSFVSSMPSLIYGSTSGGYRLFIGGLTEGFLNAYSFTSSSFLKLVPVLVFAILAVLALQLTSLFTPVRLIVMVLASVVVALAITYIALYYELHFPLLIFLPMFTVITLLAVGLDYDIFMVSRVREEVLKGKSDQEGISTSIIENGGVIITLGSLLFATFASLIFSGLGIIQEIGLGLAVGVLIDTFVSWPFFVPAVMLYLRRYNWWPSKIGTMRRIVYRRLKE
ncbi:MAG: MMPL family transporter [Thermoplasmata archaeon YP2-bin.285]|uniref:MMPL family transporter n=2 Tax=Candidatus Sysuiplasma superficiale TaxID=2823368 RepID=A0A8J7YUK5_9ARCH|nr:MMPL family transporter [Candidatus Sysuiplasma superficiale]